MKNIFMLIVLMLSSLNVLADWILVNKKDDFTDEEVRFIYFEDSNHRVQINRGEKGRMWMYITRKNLPTFEPDTQIELRIDGYETRNYNTEGTKLIERLSGETWYHWEPRTIAFIVWAGNESEERFSLSSDCGIVGELVSGTELKGRYSINGVERDTFNVPLTGLKDILSTGLLFEKCGKPL